MILKNSTERISKEEVDKQIEICRRVAEINREKYGEKKPLVCIKTFGCQQNEADSERMAGMCRLMGYEETDDDAKAKLILINTCAIRRHAEEKALSIIGETSHLKSLDPDVVIGVSGCMVSQEYRAEALKRSYPYVSFSFDTGALHMLPSLVLSAVRREKRRFIVSDNYGIAEGLPTVRREASKAWLSIMYGCNNFCTYCIVPYVRGRERSRDPEDILREAKELVDSGAKDITLLGQNVNSYGRDTGRGNIASLMREICRIPGDFKLRFMTSHPKDASDELIDVMAEEEKVVKHFHLPVQSGSNRILKAMNRVYTVEKYLEIIDKIKSRVPDVSLTSDIIVGFPGETEEDFEATLELLRRVRYDMIFSFIYSPREGTPAATMENQIPEAVSGERFKRMTDLQDEISRERNARFIGREVDLLCESVSKTKSEMITARCASPRPVHFEGGAELVGKTVRAEITDCDTYNLFAKLIEVKE